MWVDAIRTYSELNPEFKITHEEANFDQMWSLKETNKGIQETYTLLFNETDGCITGAGSGVILRSDTEDYSKRDLFLDFVRGFFSDTDGGTWYKEQLQRCSGEDEIFEEKFMKDNSGWRIQCEDYKEDYRLFSLTIRVAD
jgi:hypothetical protein